MTTPVIIGLGVLFGLLFVVIFAPRLGEETPEERRRRGDPGSSGAGIGDGFGGGE